MNITGNLVKIKILKKEFIKVGILEKRKEESKPIKSRGLE